MKNRPTIRDVAKRCGVSRTTVSAALRGQRGVSEAVRGRIVKTATELGYVVDPKLSQVMRHIASGNKDESLIRIALVGAPGIDQPPSEWYKWNGLLDRYFQGAKRHLTAIGCGFDCFWMGDPGMSSSRLSEILYSRGIDGVVFMLDYGKGLVSIDFDFDRFATAVMGRSLMAPKIHAAESDLMKSVLLAMNQVKEHGYERPGLLIRHAESERAQHGLEAAFLFAQSQLPPEARIPICIFPSIEKNLLVKEWYDRYEPDVIIGHEPPGFDILVEQFKIRIPQDVAFVALEIHGTNASVSGIEVHPEKIAAAAVNLAVNQVRYGLRGIPSSAETVMIDCEWYAGDTLPLKAC